MRYGCVHVCMSVVMRVRPRERVFGVRVYFCVHVCLRVCRPKYSHVYRISIYYEVL